MKKLKYWIPALLVLIFIWGNSLLNGTISEYISSFIHMLFSGKDQVDIIANGYDVWLRKLAHFSEYAVLAMSCMYGLWNTLDNKKRCIQYIWLFTLVAPLDETLQLFVEGRNGSMTDVLIDTSGFILGFLIVFLWLRWFEKKA